ncbi:MAG TPA: hypothetical protein VFK80_11970, partial [Limnochordia bacterium]|nr:hypothetical protein [Limnochordia bacterium]
MAEHIALGVDLGWQHGAKQGIGTAAARDSKVWFTIAKGALSEVYFPRIDSACLRDLKLVVVGPGFIHDEQRDMHNEIARPEPRALAYCITSRGPDYVLTKEICTDPKGDALLIRVRFTAPKTHRLVLITTPRLGNRGAGGNAGVEQGGDPAALRAWRDDLHVCLLADRPWRAATCGYTGPDDPWHELARHGRLVSRTTHAANAHVVLAAELDCSPQRELRLAVGFGRHEAKAFWSAQQALGRPFPQVWAEYCAGWRQAAPDLSALGRDRPDGGRQAQLSAMLLLALEDKQHPGACIASPSVPWGEARDDHERGGYHL